MVKTVRLIAARLIVAPLLLVATLASGVGAQGLPAVPIPQDPRDPAAVEDFIGDPARPKPLSSFAVPDHPFMAGGSDSNIHNDAYQTDTYSRPGPLGKEMEVTSTFHVAECASVTFDDEGRIVTICVGVEGPRLVLMDPVTLETLAVHPLPPRSGAGTGSGIFNDFSGGGYFYLDHKDRAVLPTNNRQIWVLGHNDNSFELVRTYDLTATIPVGENIVSVLPDWNGTYWFVTTKGLVGTVDRDTGTVQTMALDEVVSNSFAVDDSGGVYIVSDFALYRFDADDKGRPKVTWRVEYDRGKGVKPGQASHGSGTTPTIVGNRYVAITDNADPRMNILVYERGRAGGGSLLCKEPVFKAGRSNTDQSLVSVGNSIVTENNYGYGGPTSTMEGATTTPGLTRIDFGPGGCRTVWESKEIAPSVVPKVSLATGLVYTYTKPPNDDGVDPWYLTAIDFRTGKTVFKKLAGTGLGYNNNYAPVTLGPDAAAYVGVLGGLVRLHDAEK